MRSEWGLECYFSSFRSNARGVAILFNNNFDYKIRCVKGDDNGNLLVINMDIGDNNITLVNLYGPNTDLPRFYEDISKILGDLDAHLLNKNTSAADFPSIQVTILVCVFFHKKDVYFLNLLEEKRTRTAKL